MSVSGDFLGALRRYSRRAHVISAIWKCLFASGVVVYGWFFPSFCSDCASQMWIGYLIAAVAVAIGLTWFYFSFRGALRSLTESGDPLRLAMARCGDADAIARGLEQDFAGEKFRPRRVYVGRDWICYAWKSQVSVVRIDSLIWAYCEKVRHSVNLIPTGTTKQFTAWDRHGVGTVMPMRKQKDIEAALLAVSAVAPWVFIGYTEALKESWNNDREDLIAVVDAARHEAGN